MCLDCSMQLPMFSQLNMEYKMRMFAADSALSGICRVSVLLVLTLLSHGSSSEGIQYRILEESPIDEFVGNVATDAGLSENYKPSVLRTFRYSFLEQLNKNHQYFHIEEVTGIIRTAKPIDRDRLCPSKPNCILEMDIAIKPAQYFQVIPISVEIVDINDNSPSFPDPMIVINIPESSPVMSSFTLPVADDPDGETNSVQRYEIRTDPWEGRFALKLEDSPDGSQDLQLVLTKELDREEENFYQIRVIAVDGGIPARSGTLLINITVGDANDNHPEFTSDTYNIEVPESSPVGFTFATVQATDKDIGRNGKITYSFSPRTEQNHGELFGIDPDSGEVYTRKPLDYEAGDIYHLVVTASDGGPDSRPDQATITVHVLDVNDNAPQIIINTLTSGPVAHISESSPPGTFVAHLSVRDPDSGQNGEVRCSLLHHEHFELQEMGQGGFKVVTRGILDREIQDKFYISLSCRDNGEPPLISMLNITILVTDYNDHSPRFTESLYATRTMENNQKGHFLLQVTATDRDIGNNSLIKYELGPDAPADLVNISPDRGIIRASKPLDHEKDTDLYFSVIAYDQGTPARSATASVSISIQDINDEPPKFAAHNFSFGIYENEDIGYEVGNPVANDLDSHPFNIIEYSLWADGPDVYSAFNLDPTTGIITTLKVLDREEQDKYFFKVIAKNKGAEHLAATAAVTVHVGDQNDNAPVVAYPISTNSTISVSNMVPLGHVIARIRATDKDTGAGAKLTYNIVRGNDDHLFDIDEETGAITVNNLFRHIDYKVCNLTIKVEDEGNPQMSTKCKIYIVINDKIIYHGPGMAGHDAQDSEGSSSALHSNIVVIVGCSSAIVIIILIAAILTIHIKDRRSKALHRYNCRMEAQRMLHNTHSDDVDKRTPSPQFSPPPTTEFTYQSYLKLNPNSTGSPVRSIDRGPTMAPPDYPTVTGSIDGSPRNSVTDADGEKARQSWPTALNHTIVQDPQSCSTTVPNSKSPQHPMLTTFSKESTLPARRSTREVVPHEPHHYGTMAHVVYPVSSYKGDRLRTGWHGQKDPDANSACSGEVSATDSGRGASEEGGELGSQIPSTKHGRTFHNTSDTSENDKHSVSFDSTGSNSLMTKEGPRCCHGNTVMLPSGTLPSRSLNRPVRGGSPCTYVPAVSTRADNIPLSSFKSTPAKTISPVRKDTAVAPASPRSTVIETDIDTGYHHTIKRGPVKPATSKNSRNEGKPSRDSGCYSNGDINKYDTPPGEHQDSNHLDTSFSKFSENGDTTSVVSSTSGSYVLDPAEQMRLKMANLRESIA